MQVWKPPPLHPSLLWVKVAHPSVVAHAHASARLGRLVTLPALVLAEHWGLLVDDLGLVLAAHLGRPAMLPTLVLAARSGLLVDGHAVLAARLGRLAMLPVLVLVARLGLLAGGHVHASRAFHPDHLESLLLHRQIAVPVPSPLPQKPFPISESLADWKGVVGMQRVTPIAMLMERRMVMESLFVVQQKQR